MKKRSGWLVGFKARDGFLQALRLLVQRGRTDVETLTPFDIEEINAILQRKPAPFAQATFFGGLSFLMLGLGLQVFINVWNLPLNIGGRPLNSWPAFVPVSFVMMILGAGLGLTGAFFRHLGLPAPWHPWFETEFFDLSRMDRFAIFIPAVNNLDEGTAWQALLQADSVEEVSCAET